MSQYRRLLEGLLCLFACGASLVGFRIYFMGNKPPEFAPSDNPASDSDRFLTRTLTYNLLPSLNFWLLIFPYTLSFDWSMEAIPLVESVTWGNLANVLNDKGREADAEEAYRNALKYRGNMADVHYNL
nr:hypothetical protein BaRGS_010007 [Batillaria attramentaria]